LLDAPVDVFAVNLSLNLGGDVTAFLNHARVCGSCGLLPTSYALLIRVSVVSDEHSRFRHLFHGRARTRLEVATFQFEHWLSPDVDVSYNAIFALPASSVNLPIFLAIGKPFLTPIRAFALVGLVLVVLFAVRRLLHTSRLGHHPLQVVNNTLLHENHIEVFRELIEDSLGGFPTEVTDITQAVGSLKGNLPILPFGLAFVNGHKGDIPVVSQLLALGAHAPTHVVVLATLKTLGEPSVQQNHLVHLGETDLAMLATHTHMALFHQNAPQSFG
jgi:hypothetical protein